MAHATRPRTLDPERLQPLESWLAAVVSASRVKVTRAELLPGGAIGENWRLSVHVSGGPRDGTHDWVLRTDASTRVPLSHDRISEFACLEVAHGAGVTVPEPIGQCADPDVIGAPFMIVDHLAGTAQARRIVRDPAIARFGESLAERLGAELARLHAVRPRRPELGFLAVPSTSPARQQVAEMRAHLDSVSAPRPALEYVLTWLERNEPADQRLVLCHGDYRTGNYMVDRASLTGILDWEFAHWGDPHGDVGWFCARCWRFGADDREAGGIAGRAAFYRGYDSATEHPLDPAVVPYWEILATARWAVIALMQGERHVSGAERSVELLLTGLMASEIEFDALSDITALEHTGRRAAHG